VRTLRAGGKLPAEFVELSTRVLLALPLCIPALVFGGNVSEVETGSAVVGCLLVAGLFASSAFQPFAQDRRVMWMVAATCVLAVWSLLQLVPGTALGTNAQQWQHIADLTRQPISSTATLAIDETWRAVPVAFAVWSGFWIGALGFAKRSRQAVLWVVVLAFVVGNCAYGLGLYAAGRNEVLGMSRDAWILDATGGIVSGTFINRNHFALLCCFGLALSLTLMTRAQPTHAKTWRQKFRASLDQWPVLVLLPTTVTLLAAAFLSQSRGGMLSALVVVAAAVLMRIKNPVTMVAIALGLAIAVPVLYQATHLTDYARARVTGSFLSSANDRLNVHVETAQAIVANGGLGVGAGAFERGFPLFRHELPTVPGVWNAAHGSYVEWPFTYGVPWFLILLATVGAVMLTILRARERTGQSNVALPVLILIPCVLHIFYDFGLQTLGLAIIVAGLAGSSWARAIVAAHKSSRRHAPRRSAQAPPRPIPQVSE
jgi:hypothetical protein